MIDVYRLHQSGMMLCEHDALDPNVHLDHLIVGRFLLLSSVLVVQILAGDSNIPCKVDQVHCY